MTVKMPFFISPAYWVPRITISRALQQHCASQGCSSQHRLPRVPARRAAPLVGHGCSALELRPQTSWKPGQAPARHQFAGSAGLATGHCDMGLLHLQAPTRSAQCPLQPRLTACAGPQACMCMCCICSPSTHSLHVQVRRGHLTVATLCTGPFCPLTACAGPQRWSWTCSWCIY